MDHHLIQSSKIYSFTMKFVLISVVCLVGVVLAKPTKVKRDVLPGDSRYGTDYHHQHHAQQLQRAKPSPQYIPSGPVVTYQPSERIGNAYLIPIHAALASLVYEQPQVPHQQYQAQSNAYISPAAPVDQPPVVHYTPTSPSYQAQRPSNQYLGSVITTGAQHATDSYGSSVDHQVPVQQHHHEQVVHQINTVQPAHVHTQAVHHVQVVQPAVHHQTHSVPQNQVIYQSVPQSYSSGSHDSHQQHSTSQVSYSSGHEQHDVPQTYHIQITKQQPQQVHQQYFQHVPQPSHVEEEQQSVNYESVEAATDEHSQKTDSNGGYVY